MQNKSIMQKILNEQHEPKVKKEIIESALDSEIAERLLGKLKLEFYADDLEASKTNGLGASQKLFNIYLTCADVPYDHRIQSEFMEKVLTVDRKKLNQLKTNNYDPVYELFEVVREDLKELMNQGIKVIFGNGQESQVSATISHQCGDNLSVYELLGLNICFNNNSFYCRFCGWGGIERDGIESIQNHDLNPALINDDSEAPHLIDNSKRGFVFNGLPGITRWNLASADDLHDLHDGQVPEFTANVLTRIVKKCVDKDEKAYSLGTIKDTVKLFERRIEEFNFHEGRPSIAWNGFFSIKGKAMQVCQLFILSMSELLFY